MMSNLEFYSAMASYTATHLTDSWQKWTAFLTTASRLYKYPFHEQLMIFAQRPDATACAEYDLWNDTMRRYVRRGSKGIALVDNSREKPRLRYVFDISDTGLRKNSRHPFLWELRPEHEAAVAQALTERFGAPPENNLAEQLESIAAQLVSEYWVEHKRDILDIVDGSFLEGYDEFNIGVQFRNAATVSITYSLLSRCGLEPEGYFDHEDFLSIFDFNTPEAVAALGTAVSQSNQQVLRQIGITIQNYERAKFAERSVTHGEQPDLHEERRLSDPRPEAGGNEAPGPVREDAPGLSEGASAGPVQRHDGERETVPAPERDRADHEPAAGADDAGADAGGGRDGGTESPRSDDLGGADEQLQSPGGGNPSDGTYIQLTLFPSEQEQIRRIDEGPGVFASGPSAVPEPEPAPPAPAAPHRALTQADIDAAIQEWNGNIESKHAVVRYMKDHAREKDTAAWLRQEYGDALPAFPVTANGAAGDAPWPKVQRRIAQLIKEDRFYTQEEQDRFDNIDPIAIREALAERGIVDGQVADPEKLVRAVERDRGLMETFLDFVRGLKNRIAIRLSGSERAMLDEAERTLVNLLRGEAGSVAGEKYSFVRATDAEQIARAQELEAQGENAKTIWSETHLTRDGGGAWVREINDRGAKPRPDGDARGEKGGRLADYLEHPELYEAEPGIADINVELGTLSESEKGKYSLQERTLRFTEDTFKNKSMSDIMHEVQHAIQNEEELAAGGSRKLAYAALVSDAYEAVKDTPEFQSLQTKEERLHYLEEAAAKQAGAPDIETAATNGYVNLGGEKMARQTAKRWYYTKDQREKTWPDVAGNVLDKSVESQRIVETLERIGYTKNEIRGLLGG